MIRLKVLRTMRNLSQRELGKMSNVDPSYICRAEKFGCPPYPGQQERIANALGWEGDPAKLFEEVKEDAIKQI